MMSRRIFRKCQLPARTIKEQFSWRDHYISISVGWVYITFPSLPHPRFSFSQELFFPHLSFSYNFTEIIKFKLVWQELFSCLFSRDPSHFFHSYFYNFTFTKSCPIAGITFSIKSFTLNRILEVLIQG